MVEAVKETENGLVLNRTGAGPHEDKQRITVILVDDDHLSDAPARVVSLNISRFPGEAEYEYHMKIGYGSGDVESVEKMGATFNAHLKQMGINDFCVSSKGRNTGFFDEALPFLDRKLSPLSGRDSHDRLPMCTIRC
jgi:hypothetical protein